MKNPSIKTLISVLTVVFLIVPSFVFGVTLTRAPQTPPQILLTWSASNFYPSTYHGRALPTPGTPVTISVALLQNGTFTDLSNVPITWYKNEEKLDSGTGLTQTTFQPGTGEVGNNFIRAELTLGDSTIDQSVLVPVTNPTVAIEIPYPYGSVDANSDITLRATPFFFNISSLQDLIFYWQVGDVKKDMGSNNSISVKVGNPFSGDQKKIPVSSYIQDKKDMTNIIKTDSYLYIK